jgi:hypothetical protein
MTKKHKIPNKRVLDFRIRGFRFVSDFVLGISDFESESVGVLA